MYIFRSKNKRDNRFPSRKLIFAADTTHKGFNLAEDDSLRHHHEEEHVSYFYDTYFKVLSDYLVTENGQSEVKLLRKELGNVRLSEIDSKDSKEKSRWLGISSLFQRANPLSLVTEKEAVDLLMGTGLRTVENDALTEFRRAHPPRFLCHKCKENFTTANELEEHLKDRKEFHADYQRLQRENEEKSLCVKVLFRGAQGRTLMANRLLFSPHFGSLGARLSQARETNYRPFLADIGGKTAKQQALGQVMTGFNPAEGIRPRHRTFGMVRQHDADVYLSDKRAR
jgi:hypothetical protein